MFVLIRDELSLRQRIYLRKLQKNNLDSNKLKAIFLYRSGLDGEQLDRASGQERILHFIILIFSVVFRERSDQTYSDK